MGGRERDTDPAFQTLMTGIDVPSAEGGTVFFSSHLPPFFCDTIKETGCG